MRLFVAIQLSDELKTAFTGTMHELKLQGVKGSYVPAQNLHLTLAFIGESGNTGAVREAMKTVRYRPFRLSLAELGSFGDVLWVGVKGNQSLSGLAKDLREALDAAGIAYDRKKFAPHITIVRRASGDWRHIAAPRGDMMVKKVSLMKSEEKGGKRVYTELFSV